jgi:hypothetical protein
LFLEIPGCKTGKHTTEKPVLAKSVPKHPVAAPTSSPDANAATKDSCSRCRQGFFCSDHGLYLYSLVFKFSLHIGYMHDLLSNFVSFFTTQDPNPKNRSSRP